MKECLPLILLLSFTGPGLAETDITFIVGSDLHFGAGESNMDANRATIDWMNEIPGTAYPDEIGGEVDTPAAVVLCGDLTDKGTQEEWDLWEAEYGLNGEARLKYPVYEGFGNHDGGPDSDARNAVRERNRRRQGLTAISENGLHYSWDLEGVHFIQANLYVGSEGDDANFNNTWNKPEYSLEFIIDDLAENVGGNGRPVIIFQHYGWDDFSMDAWGNGGWWSDVERAAMYDAIKDYNVIGIFWGHSHAAAFTQWEGIDVYNDASTQRDPEAGEAFVVRITGESMTMGHRFPHRWGQVEQKPVDMGSIAVIDATEREQKNFKRDNSYEGIVYSLTGRCIRSLSVPPGMCPGHLLNRQGGGLETGMYIFNLEGRDEKAGNRIITNR